MAHSQEATHLHAELDELKIKWVELQEVVNLEVERESSSMDRISNLEANLHSNTEEATTTEDNKTKMEERFRKVMEQNWKHSKTNIDLAGAYNILKVNNERLQLKIQKLQTRFWDKEGSLLLEKHVVYSMERKTLGNCKNGISNIEERIAETFALE